MKRVPFLLLCCLLSGTGCRKPEAEPEVAVGVVRIMPLGDSITQGHVRFASYRRPLWQLLKQAGYRVDFVGSQQRHRGGGPNTDDFDPDHEGHWGWAMDRVLPELPGWLAAARPDIVLLHLGTNDALRGHPDEESVKEWFDILRLIQAANPDVLVLAARLIPALGQENSIERMNRSFEIAWANQPIPGLDLRWVDQFTGFDPKTDTWDGIHPNHLGDRKLAERWFAALREVLPPPSADPR